MQDVGKQYLYRCANARAQVYIKVDAAYSVAVCNSRAGIVTGNRKA